MDMNISPLFARVNKLAVLTSINYSNKFAYMRYGERLKLARGDRTQEWLASEAKVSQSLIWQLENSLTAKGSQYTNRFARVLEVSADWLADEIGVMRPTTYSTSDPTLVEILKVLEPRGDYAAAPLSKDDEQILGVADYLPPDKLDGLINRIEEEGGSKLALLAKLRAIQREGEAIEPPPEPPKPAEPPSSTKKGKPYKLPGIAKPDARHHKKRVA